VALKRTHRPLAVLVASLLSAISGCERPPVAEATRIAPSSSPSDARSLPVDLSISFHPGFTDHFGWTVLSEPLPLHLLGSPGAAVIRATSASAGRPMDPLIAELFGEQLARARLPDTSLVVDEQALCSPQLLAATRRARPHRLLVSMENGLFSAVGGLRAVDCLQALPVPRLYLAGCLHRSHRANDPCDGDAELGALVANEAVRSRIHGLAVSLSTRSAVAMLAKLPQLEYLAIVNGRNSEPGASFEALPFDALQRVRYLDVSTWEGELFLLPRGAAGFIGRLHTLRAGMFPRTPLPACALRRVSSASLKEDDVRALASCKDLIELSTDSASFSSAEAVSHLSRLERLHLRHFRAPDLTPLGKLVHLQLLSLGGSDANDFGFVARLAKLRTVDLSQTPLRDLTMFSTLKELKELDAGFTSVSDLSPLQSITTLVDLDLHETKVVDISPLAKLTALRRLNLSKTNVTDLSPLAKHPSLEWIILYDSQVSDVSALLTLPKLKRVHIGGLSLPPDQVAKLRQSAQLDGAR
jgi:hypothetical protein